MRETFKFQAALDQLKGDLQQMLRQKAELEKRINGTKQSITGLLALRDAAIEDSDSETEDVATIFADAALIMVAPDATRKLVDLCRSAVQASSRQMSAPEIRDEVELMGFDFSKYSSNPLSTIHTTLRRIPEVVREKVDGKTVYKWTNVGDPVRAGLLIGLPQALAGRYRSGNPKDSAGLKPKDEK